MSKQPRCQMCRKLIGTEFTRTMLCEGCERQSRGLARIHEHQWRVDGEARVCLTCPESEIFEEGQWWPRGEQD